MVRAAFNPSNLSCHLGAFASLVSFPFALMLYWALSVALAGNIGQQHFFVQFASYWFSGAVLLLGIPYLMFHGVYKTSMTFLMWLSEARPEQSLSRGAEVQVSR